MFVIKIMVEKEMLEYIRNTTTPREAWHILDHSLFEQNDLQDSNSWELDNINGPMRANN
jgi:hypothetical protein